ncbi:sorting nexin Mvp1 [Aspergillus candidus]|uniref:Sorting nexin MVP1 n=1 Tax=Aspergillus candidus TaxID=41067 RepID=A0A2I2F8S6_ASPCN|nr:hypothetical protein BDW47DRAFT_132430 [Aspergillus candidus]PLB37046.1 hypothetical protein BDW47DRAFT_132430 [Aspergillus candidus]
MLDHDPNESRRKRRKTDTPSGDGPTAGSTATHDPQNAQPSRNGNNLVSEPPSAGNGDPNTTKPENGSTPAHTSSGAPTNSPKRKMVKLNPNGKLLSSPKGPTGPTGPTGPKGADDKSKKRRASARVKPVPKTKVVVLKYENQIGKLVDDIIAGRTKYAAKPIPSIPKKEHPPQPPKPTHPFFMKKPVRKADTPETLAPQDSTPVPSDRSQVTRLGSSNNTPFVTFRPRPKFPDAIHPIWPPRDLAHVRGFQGVPDRTHDDTTTLRRDERKAKSAAVSISDHESVLVSPLRSPIHDPKQILRVPDRHLASGPTLQKAVARQLSSMPGKTGHHAITSLHSSIPTSLNAFDRGDYESSLWAHKYAPTTAEQVLQVSSEVTMLRDWLKHLMVSTVDTGKPSQDNRAKKEEKKRKKQKKPDKMDGFIVSSGDEASEMDEVAAESDDELAGDVTVSAKRTVVRMGDRTPSSKVGDKGRLSNAILLSGPPGCGKTASVYAVAKELDFEVFELNPGSRRSARDIVERVGDMTRNHLVHHLSGGDDKSRSQSPDPSLDATDENKQNKLMGFFKPKSTTQPSKESKVKEPDTNKEPDPKRGRTQKQSLILLEEADLLFEDDKQFWSGVLTLITQSKRPIIITCNEESLIPVADISLHAILRYRPPPPNVAADYLLLLASNEGHMVRREAVVDLYLSTGRDLRRTIMELDFWCQMALGSEKSGIDWLIDRWPQGADLDPNGDPLRVVSLNTYHRYMGWFSRDMLMDQSLDGEVETQQEALSWWRLSAQDSEIMEMHRDRSRAAPVSTRAEQHEQLRNFSEMADMRSVMDLLSTDCPLDPKMDAIDTSSPPPSEKQRPNYIDGYPLLNAELVPDYSSLQVAIGSTFEVLLGRVSRGESLDVESSRAAHVLANMAQSPVAGRPQAPFLAAFQPILRANYVFPIPTGRLAPSFDNGISPIAEDLAPYIRAIMAFDLRLERYRLQLSGVLSHGNDETKRIRTTRASRAALEGGSKSDTRRERWFPMDANPGLIQSTGGQGWQDLLVQQGHFPESPGGNSAQRSKSSLFADDPSSGGGGGPMGSSSLFADDDEGAGGGSPWGTHASKRTGRHELVKTLLPESDVPDSYIDSYDLVLSVGDRVGSGVGLTSVREILSGSGLTATDQAKILNLVVSGEVDSSTGLGRSEFNVLLALVGLAQEGEDLTLDMVDDRRKKLPTPHSSYFDSLRAKQEPPESGQSQDRPTTPPPPHIQEPEPSPAQSRRERPTSMGGLESDPWGSPDMHRGHTHTQAESENPVLNGYGSARSATNAWSTKPGGSLNGGRGHGRMESAPSSGGSGFGWGESFGAPAGGGSRAGLGGFGPPSSDADESNPRRRSLGMGGIASPLLEELVTITLLPEKEGMFMFQHRNYEVKSARRGSTVVRRYSDFVWLLDCLQKRYPFRQLPLLPPKRLAVNGTYLAADSTSFLEKRRRGLVRFTNALVRHPVLSQEQLVIMFLTVPTELSVWRKQATISVQDEFSGRALPPDLEESLPANLTELFDTVRNGVKRSAEVYIQLCTLLERLAKRNEGLAADQLRFSLALQSLTEVTRETYAVDTNDVPLLNEGIKATARHLTASQSLLEDEARAWEAGMLEDLKRQRDCLVSVRDLFDRRDRYARNNIPQLERRIEGHERRLQELRAGGTGKPGEIEKVEDAIFKHARGVFIRECVRDELVYFQQSQYHISRLHQDWSQERVKYAELQADNWRSLSDQVEGMPLGD